MLGYGDSAIATYQSTVLDDRNDIDGWLGLGEALVHYAAFAGASTRDARPAFERVAALDSAFAPIYDHLVDLAVYDGDERPPAPSSRRMRRRTGRCSRARSPRWTPLRHAGRAGRRAGRAGRRRPPGHQRGGDLLEPTARSPWALADTAAGFLLGRDRMPDDRRRGAEYRLVALAALGRWPEGLRPAGTRWPGRRRSIPGWCRRTWPAGPPRRARRPMYDWARAQMEAGRAPDFSLPPWDELRQGFEALVYRAAVRGDSAEARDLLARIDRAPPAGPAEPAPDALRFSLRARLALLAADTAAAIDDLRRAVARIPEVYTANHPFTAVAPQRLLLSRLLLARGDTTGSERWRRSFTSSWSVADQLYLPRLDSLGTGLPLPRPGGAP